MNCRFCKIPCEEVLWETDTSIIVTGSQFRHGHLKVILKRHVEDLTELPIEEYARFCEDLLESARVVQKLFSPHKINYALLGNWVPHLHWHIYPRYRSDPDWGQPMVMHWKANGERKMPPEVELRKKPLTSDEKKRLKKTLEASFTQKKQ
jgi:diadenosine tetraphosphate (Ap4A) HIT family hydrolase